jgi:large subunit ribosomal protein L22
MSEETMTVKAEARYVRVSPQKARLVIDLIRGENVHQALALLQAVNKRVAPAIEKLVRSAMANAGERWPDVDVDRLYVREAYVNEGPRLKRIRPAPMGRAYRYQRRTSHIVVKVAEEGKD